MGLLLLLACVVGISFYLFAASFVLLGTLAPHSGVTLFLVLNAVVFVYMAEKSIFAEGKFSKLPAFFPKLVAKVYTNIIFMI